MALPPSSPRLPSPPPPAEIQIGPNSPATSGGSLAQKQMEQQMEQTVLDANSKRRIHPGTRAADFAVGPPLVPLNELDSAFQLQEHLSALHYFHTANNTQPISRETAHTLAQPPPNTDRTLWMYELCRFLIAQCNGLIVGFLFDTPPCSAATCPEMRASEWQFLCAVHEQPKSCCAIDYCCHTLDWAANVVTNPKIFPSRFVFADAHDKNSAVKNLVNVFRRLHRIFAHAWFQHRGVFWSVEGQTGLYVLFKTVCDMYDLLPAENYKLPPEAEGLDMTAASASAASASATSGAAHNMTGSVENVPGLISIASLADRQSMGFSPSPAAAAGRRSSGAGLTPGDDEHLQAVGRTNTRRHIRSSPSTGSAVTTVLEQDEESAARGAHSALTNGTFVPVGFGPERSSNSPRPPISAVTAHAASPPSITVREHTSENHEGDADGPEVAETAVVVQHDEADQAPEDGKAAAEDTEKPAEEATPAIPAEAPADSDTDADTKAAEGEKEAAPAEADNAQPDETKEEPAEDAAQSSGDDGNAETSTSDAADTDTAATTAPAEEGTASSSEEQPAESDVSLANTSVLDFAPSAEDGTVVSDFAEKVATAPEEAVEEDAKEASETEAKAATNAE